MILKDETLTLAGDKISSYFKIAKNCGFAGYPNDCFPSPVGYDYKNTYSGTWNTVGFSGYSFITADGMSVTFTNYIPGCNGGNLAASGKYSKDCIYNLAIDVNGLNKPNILGRDIFKFGIVNGQGPAFLPFGGLGSTQEYPTPWSGLCDGSSMSDGNWADIACAARVIQDGWQMNY